MITDFNNLLQSEEFDASFYIDKLVEFAKNIKKILEHDKGSPGPPGPPGVDGEDGQGMYKINAIADKDQNNTNGILKPHFTVGTCGKKSLLTQKQLIKCLRPDFRCENAKRAIMCGAMGVVNGELTEINSCINEPPFNYGDIEEKEEEKNNNYLTNTIDGFSNNDFDSFGRYPVNF